MKKTKKLVLVIIVCLATVLIIVFFFLKQNWTIRYASVFNSFFGKGNWECISQETKDSLIYNEYVTVHNNPALSKEFPGKFKNWYILFDNGQNESVWRITDHVYKISKDTYSIFSPKRLSAKQALTMELMEISFGIIGNDIKSDIIEAYLPQAEADCIQVEMSYEGGNPKPKFYDELLNESWFNSNEISANHYLSIDSVDFYIDIKAFDYRVEKLSDTEKTHLMNSLHTIEQALYDRFGEYASFKIYFDREHRAEYENGQKLNIHSYKQET